MLSRLEHSPRVVEIVLLIIAVLPSLGFQVFSTSVTATLLSQLNTAKVLASGFIDALDQAVLGS